MTTKIAGGDELSQPVSSAAEIVARIAGKAKPREKFLIGMEYERLGVFTDSGAAIPYDTVEKILDRMAADDGWERGLEEGRIIYLARGGASITLEPGGQTEYSSPPFAAIGDLLTSARAVEKALDAAAAAFGAAYLGLGYQPFSAVGDIPWVPKTRYRYMAPYLASAGRRGHEMMKMTAGCQVALDYVSPEDAMRKLRAAVLCTPLAQALFASSGIAAGRALDHVCDRGRIWQETDDARCNIPPFMLREGGTLEEYVDWILAMPLMFIERAGRYEEAAGRTLGDLLKAGGATFYDVELALTQAFPEARLKSFVEIRCLDSPQPFFVATAPCLWSSLLYGNLDAIFDLLGGLTPGQFAELRAAALTFGLKGRAAGRSIAEWTRDLLAIAEDTTTCRVNMGHLKERVERGITPAEGARELLAKSPTPADFVTRWNRHRW